VGLLLAALLVAPAPTYAATIWHVGPGRTLGLPSEAAAVARDGDTVLIDAGTYDGDVAVWTQDDLTVRGEGGMARLPADGNDAEGKAIWVIRGDRTRVENIEFSGAEVPDGNGAGIRQEGAGLTVTGSIFRNNQNGILAGENRASRIVVRNSLFADNGAGDGYTHALYIGAVRSLTVTGSEFTGTLVGHHIKSRARRTTVAANRISDGTGTASYSIDVPNGGRTLIAGNVIEQGAASQNPTLVAYGAEGLTNPSKVLWVVNNTMVNGRSDGTYVTLFAKARVQVANNLFVGPGTPVSGAAKKRSNRRVKASAFVDAA
jgi:hypothetical protein